MPAQPETDGTRKEARAAGKQGRDAFFVSLFPLIEAKYFEVGFQNYSRIPLRLSVTLR